MKSSPARILTVAAVLMALGAVFGALAGVAAFLIAVAVTEGLGLPALGEVLAIVAAIGGVLGAVLLPSAGFLLMRRVPIGLAFAGTVVGTMLGGIAAWVLRFPDDPLFGPVVGALIGFVLAVIVLRLRFSTGTAAQPGRGRVSVG